MNITVRATHRDSTRKIGEMFVVKEETVLGPLTGMPMHEIIGEIEGRTQYIFAKYCEPVNEN